MAAMVVVCHWLHTAVSERGRVCLSRPHPILMDGGRDFSSQRRLYRVSSDRNETDKRKMLLPSFSKAVL